MDLKTNQKNEPLHKCVCVCVETIVQTVFYANYIINCMNIYCKTSNIGMPFKLRVNIKCRVNENAKLNSRQIGVGTKAPN